MKKQKKGLKGCIRQQSFKNKFDVKQSRIGDTVGKEPAVFFMGGNAYDLYQSGIINVEKL